VFRSGESISIRLAAAQHRRAASETSRPGCSAFRSNRSSSPPPRRCRSPIFSKPEWLTRYRSISVRDADDGSSSPFRRTAVCEPIRTLQHNAGAVERQALPNTSTTTDLPSLCFSGKGHGKIPICTLDRYVLDADSYFACVTEMVARRVMDLLAGCWRARVSGNIRRNSHASGPVTTRSIEPSQRTFALGIGSPVFPVDHSYDEAI